MAMNFPVCHPWVLSHEGGYVNHPKDPGGATNQGVTQRTYDGWRRSRGQAKRSVRELTADERDAIYRENYWNAVRGDELPAGLDYALYDYAVNSGPGRAAKEVQRLVGVKADGVIGPITLAAILDYPNHPGLIVDLCDSRMDFLKRLSHWPTFKNGWTRRVMGEEWGQQGNDIGVIDRGIMLHRQTHDIAPPKVKDDGANAKAPEDTVRPSTSFWEHLVAALSALFGRRTPA